MLSISTCNLEIGESGRPFKGDIVPDKFARLSVTDSGTGMDSETQQRVFEPFFATKPQGKGTGLGLSTVYGIVRQSRGHIFIDSRPGRGIKFDIYLPISSESLTKRRQPLPDNGYSGEGETILVVEDEPSLRKLCATLLRAMNYNVKTAANGGKALMMVEEEGFVPGLLVTDVVMPGISGKVLSKRLKKMHPHIKMLFMSGYSDEAISHHGLIGPDTPFIHKPFTKLDLGKSVRKLLDEGRLIDGSNLEEK